MRFEGKTWKSPDTRYWVVEVPALEIVTQGTSKSDAYDMIKDAIEMMVDQKDFKITVQPGKHGEFTISANDAGALLAFMLRQQRSSRGLTLQEMAKRLGINSVNAYARYEQGKSIPTVEKLTELLKAIDGKEPILKIA